MMTVAGFAFAQTSPDNVAVPDRAIVLTGGQNGINRQVMTVLYDTSNTHFQDPQPPRFLLIDREGRTVFGVGGYVNAVAQFDFTGALNDVEFKTYNIPVPGNPAERNRLGADLGRSNIYMMLVTHTRWGVLKAYAKGDFSDDNYGFRLKQAYVSLHNVTAGLTRSLFQDLQSGFPTIDRKGPSGAISAKTMQMRYSLNLNKHFSFALSAEIPKVDFTTLNGYNRQIAPRLPDLPAYLQYQWNEGKSHIRASALFRQMSYRNLVTNSNKFATGWAVQLSGALNFADKVVIFYQGVYGKGAAQYINDLADEGFDLIYSGRNGDMTAPPMLGLVGGIKSYFSSKMFMSSAYSLCRLYGQDALGDDTYRRGNYSITNFFYNPLPELRLGVEFIHGIRTNMNGIGNSAYRLQTMVQYSF